MAIRHIPPPATALEAAERPHPQPLLSADAMRALYAGQAYRDEARRTEDNTPFERPLRHSPLSSTMDF